MARTQGAKDKRRRRIKQIARATQIIGGATILGAGFYLYKRNKIDTTAMNKSADAVMKNADNFLIN